MLSGSIIGLMGEGLLTRDPQTMEIKPLLAESVKNLNPNTWEIKLRRGVKFHNGEDFNADSVKFTIERAILSKLNTLAKLTWPPSFGQDVVIVDPYTVRIVTKVPDPMVPSRLAAESMNIAPAKGLAEYKDKFVTDRFIGTGPVPLRRARGGRPRGGRGESRATGARSRPAQKIVWQVIPDAATRLAALQRGDVDVMLNLPFPLAPTVEGDPNLRVYSELSSLTHGILLNARESAPLKDRRVRQALNMAVDRAGHPQEPLLRARPAPQHGHRQERGQHHRPGRLSLRSGARQGPPRGGGLRPGLRAHAVAVDRALGAGRGDGAGHRGLLGQDRRQDQGAGARVGGVQQALRRLRRSRTASTTRSSTARGTPPTPCSASSPTSRPSATSTPPATCSRPSRSTSAPSIPSGARSSGAKALKGLHDEAVWLFLWQLDELFGVSQEGQGLQDAPGQLPLGARHLRGGLKRFRSSSAGSATPPSWPSASRSWSSALVHLSGDPVLLMVSSDAPPDVVAATRHALGFDRPLYEQFARYVTRAAQGDLGMSLRSSRPVAALIRERLPATVELTLAALLIAVAVAMPAGIVSAVKRGSAMDRARHGGRRRRPGRAHLLARAAADRASSACTCAGCPSSAAAPWPTWCCPAVSLSTMILGRLARLVRSSMLEVLGQDYVRTARAKGVGEVAGARRRTRSRTRRSRSSPCSACSSPSSWAARW